MQSLAEMRLRHFERVRAGLHRKEAWEFLVWLLLRNISGWHSVVPFEQLQDALFGNAVLVLLHLQPLAH